MRENNYAFIDSQNVNLGVQELGWRLDFRKFKIYLREKYGVSTAYLFMGYIEENQKMYRILESFGYEIIFKRTLRNGSSIKGNCDGELILHAMIHIKDYGKALVVSGDGDFSCLVEYLIGQGRFRKLLIPNQQRYSALLKGFPSEYVAFLSDFHQALAYKKRTP